ncbi:MAG TPA: hypothetical protein VJW76_01975 [Verrucomicrobiae bacterium]|nr:hypothetical protein [Verrucomicrobiae bacterium]
MKTGSRQQLLIILTAAVVALFAGDRLIYSPLLNLWRARAKEIKELQGQIRRGSATIKNEPVIQGKWTQMQTNTLPGNQSAALEKISKAFRDWAEESGASLNGVTPQWKSDSDDYKTVVCRVDASGTLWMLSRFIYDIEKDPMGLKVESVDFSSRDNTGQQMTLALQVSGLVLNSQEQ